MNYLADATSIPTRATRTRSDGLTVARGQVLPFVRCRQVFTVQPTLLTSIPPTTEPIPESFHVRGHAVFVDRIGDYRLQFFPESKNVIVEKIGHRDGFYGE